MSKHTLTPDLNGQEETRSRELDGYYWVRSFLHVLQIEFYNLRFPCFANVAQKHHLADQIDQIEQIEQVESILEASKSTHQHRLF